MAYMCDICSNLLNSKSDGIFYSQQRILTSPGYWEKLIDKTPGSFNDDVLSLTLQSLIGDDSGFTVCKSCSSFIENDYAISQKYGLEPFVSFIPSGNGFHISAVIVAATVWEKKRGRWPNSIDKGYIKIRNEITNRETGGNSTSQESSGCFIATATYGDYLHPDVVAFSKFRDETLVKSFIGRAFIRMYYLISPSLADIIKKAPPLRKLSKIILSKLVQLIS